MSAGFFGDDGELYFDLDLITGSGEIITVSSLLDTGFTDWLALNVQDAEELEWTLLERREMATAPGEGEFFIYEGRVVFDGEESIVPVVVGDGISGVLLGLKWLDERRLIVDRKKNRLILERSDD
ncbi:aspartyl protease [Pannus brasiliensis CCIBt3594]|uniref:Aspartyl protease n=1 Tax=Pannus brasiliensis CCIBt3594 TaxID=1427578 RepID=A0AAW9R119_9CHRO